MTAMTNPAPQDPAGPSAMDEGSTHAGGSEQLLDGGSTGTDEGPAGLPASLAGQDEDGDPVDAPPAARPDGPDGHTRRTPIGMVTGRHAGVSAVEMPNGDRGALLLGVSSAVMPAAATRASR